MVTTIRPSDIDTTQHFWDSFGSLERESSARWLVRLCQSRGSWDPFPVQDLKDLYLASGYYNFTFNGLDRDGNVVIEDGFCQVSEKFIEACYKSSPAR